MSSSSLSNPPPRNAGSPDVSEVRLPDAQLRARRFVTVGVMLGMLIAAMESTVVSTAMPTIIGDLHGIRLYAWVFSAYLLASTTTVPIYGKLADLYGRRPVFLAALALFLAGSMLAGAARSMPQLILFRGLQGLGAGGVLPVTLTIIGDLYTMEERARVQVLFTSMWSTASLAGPILGAYLTLHWSWRWVFYVNFTPGLVSALLVGGFLQEGHARAERVRLDLVGSVLLTVGIVLLLLTMLRTGEGAGFLTSSVLWMAGISVLLLIAFLFQERRAAEPMLPLTLFTHPVISASMIGNLLIGVMLYAMDTFMPLFMQGVRGGDANSASSVLTPLILCWSLSAFVSAKALVRVGFRPVALFGVCSIALSAAALTLIHPNTSRAVIVTIMAILGSGLGPASMAFLISAQNAVDWKQRGVVTATSQFFRSIGGTLGVGGLGAALNGRMTAQLSTNHLQAINPNALLNTQARGVLPAAILHQARIALESGLHLVFVLLALLSLCGVATLLRIGQRSASPDSEGEETMEAPNEVEACVVPVLE